MPPTGVPPSLTPYCVCVLAQVLLSVREPSVSINETMSNLNKGSSTYDVTKKYGTCITPFVWMDRCPSALGTVQHPKFSDDPSRLSPDYDIQWR